MKTLKEYTDLREKLADFRAKNAPVFDKAEELQRQLSEIESSLKEEVRAGGKSVENDKLTVIYRPNFHEYYDYKVIARVASSTEKALIDQKALDVEVNRKKFEELVKAGAIDINVERKAFKRDELTPRIIIKEKDNATE